MRRTFWWMAALLCAPPLIAQMPGRGPVLAVNAYTTGQQGAADVAASPDGSFVVVWESAGQEPGQYANVGVYARRFDALGNPLADEFLVNEYTFLDQVHPLDPRVPKDYLTQNLIGNFHQMLAMTWERRDWARAARELDRAASAAPDNDVLFYNLGLIYRRNGLLEQALACFRRSAEINPREIASASRPRAAGRAAEVESEIAVRDRRAGGARPGI